MSRRARVPMPRGDLTRRDTRPDGDRRDDSGCETRHNRPLASSIRGVALDLRF